jgi:hypothetical protein
VGNAGGNAHHQAIGLAKRKIAEAPVFQYHHDEMTTHNHQLIGLVPMHKQIFDRPMGNFDEEGFIRSLRIKEIKPATAVLGHGENFNLTH